MPHIQEGDILFIEDSSKDAATIERSFSLLKINGVFDKISGIILGKHEQFDDCGTNRKPFEILLEVLQNQRIPFLADFDCCHTHPMITIPIGVQVELDATNKTIHIVEPWKNEFIDSFYCFTIKAMILYNLECERLNKIRSNIYH